MDMGPLLLLSLAEPYQSWRLYCAPDRLLALQAIVMTEQLPCGVKLADLQRSTSMMHPSPPSAP